VGWGAFGGVTPNGEELKNVLEERPQKKKEMILVDCKQGSN